MELVSETNLRRALEPYRPEAQYLVRAELDYPESRGLFKIPHSVYVADDFDTGHFNAIDMLICYNQLGFATFLQASQQRDINLDFDRFSNKFFTNSLITRINNVRFKKLILGREFQGLFRIKKLRDGKISTFKTSFDFGEGKITGDINLAYLPQNQNP